MNYDTDNNQKIKDREMLSEMLLKVGYASPVKEKKEKKAPLGIINYYDKFSSEVLYL